MDRALVQHRVVPSLVGLLIAFGGRVIVSNVARRIDADSSERTPSCRGTRRSLCGLAVMGCAATAEAQDTGQCGLTIGFPASVGLIYHASDRVAIRPDFSFSTSVIESSLSGLAPTEGSTVSAGVSALFSIRKWDNLHAYVGPDVSHSRTTISSNSISEARTSGYTVTGFFGTQYSLSRRFGVFGETGVAYRHSTTSNAPSVLPLVGTEAHGHGWGTRSGVGVVLYF